ncbi:MAG: Wzy polymerase domain-containing protein [Pseudomonadota bacterium]
MKWHANLTVTEAGLVLILALPWLSPFAPGPSPAVVPLLVSLGCLALLCGVVSGGKAACQGHAVLSPHVIALSLCCAALVSSVLGLFQYLGGSLHLGPWVNQTGAGEAFANLRQRNHFASLMNIGFFCLIWFVQTTRAQHRFHSLVLYGTTIFLGVGNAVSASRTGLLQLVWLTFAYGYWRIAVGSTSAGRLVIVVWLAYWLTAWGLPEITDISGGVLSRAAADDSSCAGRRALWSNVVALIGQKPWFGWGWGELDYAHYMTLYPGERFCDILDNAHNLPLHLAVELGIPVAVLFCGIAGWLVLRARPWCETDPTRQMAWGILALILLHSLLEYPLWYGPFQITFGLCVYLLWTTRERHEPTRHSQAGLDTRRAYGRYFLGTTAVLTMAVAAYAAWDYHRVRQIYLVPAQRDAAYRENTLEKIRDTYLFRHQFDFAALSLTPLTPANALQIYTLSSELLHYSPEPRVIEKVIESAVMLRRDDEALLHLARYRAAFPSDHARWRQALIMPNGLAN